MNVEMIDTASALEAFITDLPEPTERPGLYVDLEGNDLCRHGTLSLVTILAEPRHTVHLIDVKTLGSAAFTTSASNGKTIQQILESENIIKVFFDIRNDSDALFSLFGVRVAGIEDIQLMEVVSRSSSKRLLNGLAKCIERDAPISFSDKREWRATKDEGHRLFDPARGGSFAVFDERPLTPAMQKYCAQDVLHMPGLRDAYKAKLGDAWRAKIQQETTARIALSQSATFNGKGRHMAEAPAGWQSGWPGNISQVLHHDKWTSVRTSY
jgi:exonuclease 3'-5' domain-containing protein 1